MTWFHLCRVRPCTQLWPSHWNAKQSSRALLLKHMVLKTLFLTCHRLRSLQQKPSHHAQRLLVAVWLDTARIKCFAWKWPAAASSGEIVHFSKSWRECLHNIQQWGTLKIKPTPSVSSYVGGEAQGQHWSLAWPYQRPWAGYIIHGRSRFACMELFHAPSPTFLVILEWAHGALPLQSQAHHC